MYVIDNKLYSILLYSMVRQFRNIRQLFVPEVGINDRSLYFILEVVKCSPKICILFVFLQSTMLRISGLVIPHKHKCSECHRSYSSLYNLRAHEAIHRRRYSYLCKVCGKAFQSTSSMHGHMAQHTGVAEFACGICSRVMNVIARNI